MNSTRWLGRTPRPAHSAASDPFARDGTLPARPPQGLRGGAHPDLLAPGTVTFILYAPYKPYVSLVGDFNAWDTRATPCTHDGSGLWWVTVPHPGQTRYGYYVAVDDDSHVWVGDPYARAVEWHNQENAWALLPPPRARYTWRDAGWKTPALRDLVIYELCVRDFGGRWEASRGRYGTFRSLLEKVDYLADLGINAIELMPVQAFPGDSSWGYNPVFYHAPAHPYGTPEELKRVVDACHARGIAVLLDVAFNHAWGQHPWYRIYPPMYGAHGEWLADYNPFFHQTPPAINAWGGVDWDHFVPETTAYFQDVVRFWLDEYHLDGFRFDWACGVDYDSGEPLRPGFHPYHGMSAVAWAARQQKPDCILIGEYWQLQGTHPDKTAAKLVAETDLDAVWDGVFHHTMENVINYHWEWEKQDIYRAIGGFRDLGFGSAAALVHYTASHDEVRPEHEIRYYSGKYIPRPGGMRIEEVALARAALGLVALFAGAGLPMIYSGQEFGESSPRTIDFHPLDWSLLDKPAHRAHFDRVRRLIRARRTHPALRSDLIQFEEGDLSRTGLVRFWRWDGQGDAAAVALNWTPQVRRFDLHLPFGGRWRDVVGERSITLAKGPLHLTLPPYGAALYVPE